MSSQQDIVFIGIQAAEGVLFTILGLFSMLRTFDALVQQYKIEPLLNKNPPTIIGVLYYSIVTCLCFTQGSMMITYSYKLNQWDTPTAVTDVSASHIKDINNFFIDEIYIPDSMFFLVFFIVFSQMLMYNKFAYVGSGKINPIIVNSFDIPLRVVIFVMLYMILQISFILVFNLVEFNPNYILIVDFVVTISQPIILITSIGKYIDSQGKIIKNDDVDRDLTTIYQILVFFSIGRCIQGCFLIVLTFTENFPFCIFTQTTSTIQTVAIYLQAINSIIFMIIPLFVSLHQKYLKILSHKFQQESIFLLDAEDKQLDLPNINDQRTQSSDDHDQSRRQQLSVTNHTDKTIIKIKFNSQIYFYSLDVVEIQDLWTEASQSAVQFGQLNKGVIKAGKYANKQFLIRKIPVQRLSQYLIDEMNSNIQKYRQLSCQEIQPIKALSFDDESVYFFTPLFSQGNLTTLIQKGLIEQDLKFKILLQIVIAMDYLYLQNPPVPVGHLTPNNIMIHLKTQIKIVDFGLPAIKKYIALTTGYSTKCSYSAPEQLKERSQTPNATQASEVYSFALIAYEIYHQKQAFQGLSVQELVRVVAEEKKRPKISETIEQKIAVIIRASWQDEQEKRPLFSDIRRILENEGENFQIL